MSKSDTVLLGSVDSPIPLNTSSDFQLNKIGGIPDWMKPGIDPKYRKCALCGNPCLLAVQIYCPLGESSYHRTLYIFCCINSNCWNKSESWTVLRCQQSDPSRLQSKELCKPERNPSWLDAQDNWDDETMPVGDNTSELCSATESLALPKPDDKTNFVHDFDENSMDEGGSEHNNVIPESHPISFPTEFPWKTKVDANVIRSHELVFEPHFVTVFEESESERASSPHVDNLVHEYQQHDGNPFYKVSGSLSREKGATAGESYEKSETKHGDRYFYKFNKKIARFPQQIIRYQWKNSPLLLAAAPTETAFPNCCSCGSKRVFELQLMPALVSYLKVTGTTSNETPVEFGTVIVATCQESCWQDGEDLKREHAFVQADPDESLFRME